MGYIQKIGYDSKYPELQSIISTGGATDSTYISDYHSPMGGTVALLIGGHNGYGSYCGFWCTTPMSSSMQYYTSRLLYIPNKL